MSQIWYNVVSIPLADVIARIEADDHIVVVEGPAAHEVFRREIFPIETHHMHAEESVYEEFISQYRVVRVIFSSSVKTGDDIWVWSKPAYSHNDVKRYHEIGLSRSPVIEKRESDYPVTGNRFIAVISHLPVKSCDRFLRVYTIKAQEGEEAESEIMTLIDKGRRRELKRWWCFWR
jgi:hypothetical protein